MYTPYIVLGPSFLREGPTVRKQQRMRERAVHSTSPSFFLLQLSMTTYSAEGHRDQYRVIPGMFSTE